MNNKSENLKTPDIFLVRLPMDVALQFRAYCQDHDLLMSKVLAKALTKQLIAQGMVDGTGQNKTD